MSAIDVLVVGGGVSGLATAWGLARRGLGVRVWESAPVAGGKIRSNRGHGYLTERAATLVAGPGRGAGGLIDALGLSASRCDRAGDATRYLLYEGRLVALEPKLGGMLSSPLWSARGRLRLALEPFMPSAPRGGEETVAALIRRRLGREALERAIEPYVGGPLASDVMQASAPAVLPRLVELERRYGSFALGLLARRLLRRGRPAFEAFSFQGGMTTLVQALARAPGVDLRTATSAVDLRPVKGGWRVTGRGDDGEHEVRARQVVLALPAQRAADLLAPLDGRLGALLAGIAYAPIAVVHVGLRATDLRHPVNGSGFLATRSSATAINGCLWTSSLFSGRAPRGRVLMSAYLGGARNPEVTAWDDRDCAARTLADLDRLLGVRGAPEMLRVERHRRGLPLYHGRYMGRLTAIDRCLEELPGLHLEANYRGGVAVRDRLLRGDALATRIAALPGAFPTPSRTAASAAIGPGRPLRTAR